MEDMCQQWWGKGYIGNPTDCTKWGYCQGQKLVSYGTCGNGLVFESSSGTCQYNTKVACSTSVAATCKAVTSPTYLANPNDCSSYAYCFGNGTSATNKCPAGQNYAANSNTCVWGPSCPQDSICRFMPNNIYMGDPNNCGQYIQCIKGYGKSTSCGTNADGQTLYYNAATGNCQPTNPCNGNGNVDNNPGIPGTVTPPAIDATKCKSATTSFVADGSTCYGFYSCTGKSKDMWGACPFGTEFSVTKQQCVSPASQVCLFDRCANTNLTYAAMPNTLCSQYKYCPNGAIGNCPAGYAYFDERYGKCVPNDPKTAICSS
ncbi:hypothetical protein KR093_001990 [Drosophila rubida]|uniref:Chitin-binding type-2 domain-containing protein n=1 Tax=Drosophila rubida TaxID=30044 RepID=A0AAD4PIW9_9MUSC|nr:hypothetical protein KR093_001990 [Drosophila rubida]